jgi:glycosyltransferase involved in cell wall biosynthesis
MPVKNGESFIRTALESALACTYPDYEIIVLDNGSTDATSNILAGFASIPPVRILDTAGLSLSQSLNIGITQSTGHIVVRLDADDIMYPHALSTLVECFQQHHDSAGILSDHDLIDSSGNHIGIATLSSSHAQCSTMLFEQRLGKPEAYRAEVLHAVHGYDTTRFSQYAEDYDLLLRIAEQFVIRHSNKRTYAYRQHPASLTGKTSAHEKYAARTMALRRAHERRQRERPGSAVSATPAGC